MILTTALLTTTLFLQHEEALTPDNITQPNNISQVLQPSDSSSQEQPLSTTSAQSKVQSIINNLASTILTPSTSTQTQTLSTSDIEVTHLKKSLDRPEATAKVPKVKAQTDNSADTNDSSSGSDDNSSANDNNNDNTTTPTTNVAGARTAAQKYAKSQLSDKQYTCLYKLWKRESGWRITAHNASGAYGIPQALPGRKMSSAGPNWRTNYKTQVDWGLGYISGRYGTPCGAWGHSQSTGWY